MKIEELDVFKLSHELTLAVIKAIKDEIRMKKTEKNKDYGRQDGIHKTADKLRHEDERLR